MLWLGVARGTRCHHFNTQGIFRRLRVRFRIWESSKSERERADKFADYVFKFAEHILIVGVFAFLAETTKHWAVTTIALVLGGLLIFNLVTSAQSIHFTHWKEGDGKWIRRFWFTVDLLIFAAILAVCWFAYTAVRETMSSGVGI